MDLVLDAKPRAITGKQNVKLRRQGVLPAVLYGKGRETKSLQIATKEFEKVFKQAGENTLVDLRIDGDGKKVKVLIHDVARHFMNGNPIHVDFYEVDLTKKIHAKIPVHFMGASLAVKELGGILIKNLNEVEVEALPTDLPQYIEVNIESLKTFDDLARLGDLKVSEKVKILGHPEDVVVSVQAPRSEEELAELEKPTAEEEKAAIETMTKEQEAEKAVTEEVAAEPEKAEKTKAEEKAK